MVSRAVGLYAVSHSVDYIHLYSGDKELLMQSLDHIQRVAASITVAIDSDEGQGLRIPLRDDEQPPVALERFLFEVDRSHAARLIFQIKMGS